MYIISSLVVTLIPQVLQDHEKVDVSMQKTKVFSFVIALLAVTSFAVYGDDPKTAIQQKLQATYAVTQPTADNTDIVTAGAVLVIKKGNLSLTPITSQNLYPNTYKDGKLSEHTAVKAKRWMDKIPGGSSISGTGTFRTFVPGEKLWLTKIDVKDDGIVFNLLSDPFSDVRYYGSLKFVFPKGFFPAPDAADHVVAEVFGIQPSDDAKGQTAQAGQPQTPAAPVGTAAPKAVAAEAPPAPIAPPPPPPDQPAAPPKTISKGQTPDQVTAILGAPQKDIKLGAKEIYSYPDIKVTFLNGKVSDVQ